MIFGIKADYLVTNIQQLMAYFFFSYNLPQSKKRLALLVSCWIKVVIIGEEKSFQNKFEV